MRLPFRIPKFKRKEKETRELSAAERFRTRKKLHGRASNNKFSNKPPKKINITFFNSKKTHRKYAPVIRFFQAILKRIKFLGYLGIILILAGFGYLVVKTPFFKVDQIRFEGVEQIDTNKLQPIADKYKGKNIYTVNLSDVEKDVSNLSVYIESVYAKKELPSKIIVEVNERHPKYVLVNFDGVYLVDEQKYLVAKPISDKIAFDQDEWEAYSSNNPNMKAVKARMKAEFEAQKKDETQSTDSSEEQFDFSKIPTKDKREVLNQIKTEVAEVIKSHFDSLDKKINKSEYAGLQRIYFYENFDYLEGDQIDNKKLDYSFKAVSYLDSRDDLAVSKAAWQSKFSLTIQTVEKKTFVFGVNRDIDTQISDLDTLLKKFELENQKYTKIDTRAELVTVE